jgi:hypothetical protein
MTATPRARRVFKFSRFGILALRHHPRRHALRRFQLRGRRGGLVPEHQLEEVNMYLLTDTRVQIALAVFAALAVLIGVADPSEAARFKAH